MSTLVEYAQDVRIEQPVWFYEPRHIRLFYELLVFYASGKAGGERFVTWLEVHEALGTLASVTGYNTSRLVVANPRSIVLVVLKTLGVLDVADDAGVSLRQHSVRLHEERLAMLRAQHSALASWLRNMRQCRECTELANRVSVRIAGLRTEIAAICGPLS